MTEAQVRELLRRNCQEAGSQQAWAALHGLSAPYVSDVLGGKRAPADAILGALGLQKVVIYHPRETQPA
jgi:hypothetical protein